MTFAASTAAFDQFQKATKQVERLEASLKHLLPYPNNLTVNVRCAD